MKVTLLISSRLWRGPSEDLGVTDVGEISVLGGLVLRCSLQVTVWVSAKAGRGSNGDLGGFLGGRALFGGVEQRLGVRCWFEDPADRQLLGLPAQLLFNGSS